MNKISTRKITTALTTLAAVAALAGTGTVAAGAAERGDGGTEKPRTMEAVSFQSARTALASGLAVSSPGEATNDGTGVRDYCTGTVLQEEDLINGYGAKVGYVQLWYSPENGGQNCVMTHNYAADVGITQWTDAWLWVDDDRWSGDAGSFAHYAGGAYVDNTNGKCVAFAGTVYGTNPDNPKGDGEFVSTWDYCG